MENALRLDENYTYKDYAEWDDKDENGNPIRYELIDGRAYAMAAPSTMHQDVAGGLYSMLRNFLKGRRCRPFISPFDVQLDGNGDFSRDVVQPDVLVVCDPSKITPRGCNGAPDLVVEVLSPSSTKIDLMLKYLKYEKAEVKEYWMVAPKSEIIDIATLGASKKYTITRYTEEDTIESTVLEGFEVTVKEIFSEMIRHES